MLFRQSDCLHIIGNEIHPEFIGKISDEKAANLIPINDFRTIFFGLTPAAAPKLSVSSLSESSAAVPQPPDPSILCNNSENQL